MTYYMFLTMQATCCSPSRDYCEAEFIMSVVEQDFTDAQYETVASMFIEYVGEDLIWSA